MSNWRERLIQERYELNERLVRLDQFLADPPDDLLLVDKELLRLQAGAMRLYADVLTRRIGRTYYG